MAFMIRAILLLHFFLGSELIAQKLEWVQFESTAELGTFLALLARGCAPEKFRGSLDFPSEGGGYGRIKKALEEAYTNDFNEAVTGCYKAKSSRHADSVRVVQIMEGWFWKKPAFSPI
jgi:hypothetical protein